MPFVKQDSIIRKIWGNADTILFIFGGAAAEFSLNKAVDWLYFTGRLPADPLGRLFSTVAYAQRIIFSDLQSSLDDIDRIAAIHREVEHDRGMKIPDWAYRDVLYMLIHYSIASFELLERKLSPEEKEEVFDVFYRVGLRMGLTDLPGNYNAWLVSREEHLNNDLEKSKFTKDLYKQYRRQLGSLHYAFLLQGQKLVAPARVRALLGLNKVKFLIPLLWGYKFSRKLRMNNFLRNALLPKAYMKQIRNLNML
jgi:hypothetical protein